MFLSCTVKLATADAIVYATARVHGVDRLTRDAHFAALPAVLYFGKAAQRQAHAGFSAQGAAHAPLFPPRFSSTRISPITMPRSTALHMS